MKTSVRQSKGFWPLLSLVMVLTSIAFTACSFDNSSRPSAQYTIPNPPTALPAEYYKTVKEQVAKALRLSVSQTADKIKTDPDGLFGVANHQGISQEQFTKIQLDAMQTAGKQMVTMAKWTQQQADNDFKYWQARSEKALNGDISTWFVDNK
ncbi:hypothetical protein [Ktedonobacter robiniae]|uniref:Uncharacterized protein n=1 Tax=Ktedonobacter robiniae TaxID=2778365 RepID=A0ABQ3V5C4_9CHLR|nr:hypothetical protein [Ktedonobacter robiniae]GHO60105.1 hypothetical protein KSB_85800 [Ktedonobacter robiniae]